MHVLDIARHLPARTRDEQRADLLPRSGPVFVIPSVDEFYVREQGKVEFVGEPVDIPPGRLTTAKDPSGNCLYFLDVTTASS